MEQSYFSVLASIDAFEEIICRTMAGSKIYFRLKAVDLLDNEHTNGGAVRNCTVQGAGLRSHTPSYSSSSSSFDNSTTDVVCEVSDLQNGEYDIKCQVFTNGFHDVIITNSHNDPLLLGKLWVSPAPPHGANSQLTKSNSYTALLGNSHSLLVDLYDKYKNPTRYTESSIMMASIGGHAITSHTIPDHYYYVTQDSPRLSPNTMLFTFLPPTSGQDLELRLSINNSLVPCPVRFSVDVSAETIRLKLNSLRHYLQIYHCNGTTPTLMVSRECVLESAVQVLQNVHFSMLIRVRFDSEIGMDMGGVSR